MTDAESLAEWLNNARSACIFTGAGMSTESGPLSVLSVEQREILT